MTLAIRLYEKLRLFQPLGFLFEPGASHMPDETAAMPSCLLCGSQSRLPPAKVGWIKTDNETRLVLICGDCGFDCSDAELEKKVVERVIEPVPIAAE
jgi:hypothetical protein